ncbi:MAG: hypothetical protein ACOC2K_03370 [Bacteroidota bacterium]
MKKIAFVILFLILSCGLEAQVMMKPYNTGFEESRTGNMSRGWSIAPRSIEKGYGAYADDSRALEGKYSLKLFLRDKAALDSLSPGQGFGIVLQGIDAAPYLGRKIYYRGAISANLDSNAAVQLWVNVRNTRNDIIYAKQTQPDSSGGIWKYHEMEFDMPVDAWRVNYGMTLYGGGEAWLDDVSFSPEINAVAVPEPPRVLSENEIENYAALTRLLGKIRYYYPYPMNTGFDWEKLYYNAYKKIDGIKNDKELRDTLNSIAALLSNDIKIASSFKKLKMIEPTLPSIFVNDTAYGWIHEGAYSNNRNAPFVSQLVNIYKPLRRREGTITKTLDISGVNGDSLVFKIKAKSGLEGPGSRGEIWIRIDDSTHYPLAVESNTNNPVNSSNWKEYSVVMPYPDNAALVRIALLLTGEGRVFYDDARLFVIEKDSVQLLGLNNHGFEIFKADGSPSDWHFVEESAQAGYSAKVSTESTEGTKSLLIESDTATRIIFPDPYDYHRFKLKEEIYASFPLSLKENDLGFNSFTDNPLDFELNPDDMYSRLAIAGLVWSISDNFTPFTIDKKMSHELLPKIIKEAALAKGSDELLNILNGHLSHLKDGNARAWHGFDKPQSGLPLLFKLAGSKIFVSKTSEGINIPAGSEVVAINSKPALEFIDSLAAGIPASTDQWRRLMAIIMLRAGDEDSEVRMRFVSPAGDNLEKTLKRNIPLGLLRESSGPAYQKLDSGIIYFDLTRLDDKEMRA